MVSSNFSDPLFEFSGGAASGSTATRSAWHTWHPCTRTTLCPKNWSFECPVEPTLAPSELAILGLRNNIIYNSAIINHLETIVQPRANILL